MFQTPEDPAPEQGEPAKRLQLLRGWPGAISYCPKQGGKVTSLRSPQVVKQSATPPLVAGATSGSNFPMGRVGKVVYVYVLCWKAPHKI